MLSTARLRAPQSAPPNPVGLEESGPGGCSYGRTRARATSLTRGPDERKHRRSSGSAPLRAVSRICLGRGPGLRFRRQLHGVSGPDSDTARKPVAARSRALEARVRTPRTARQRAPGRIPGHRLPETLFDATLHVGDRQGTISASQDTYDGPSDHTIAEPLRLGHGRDRPSPAHARPLGDPFQDRPQGSIVV